MKFRANQSGAISPIVIVVVVAVLAAVGFVGYRVMNKDKTSSGSSSTTTQASKEVSKAAQSACEKQLNDKDFCKFSSNWTGTTSYKAVFSTKDGSGQATSMKIESDGKNSSSVMYEGTTEKAAYISLNNVTYMKDYDAKVWYKMPSSGGTTPSATDVNPTSSLDVKIDETPTAEDKTVYKKIGKEACGKKTCFKYQITDPAATDTVEQFVWFDDKDYQLARWYTKSKDGSISDASFTYESVKISEPTPVKEFSLEGLGQ